MPAPATPFSDPELSAFIQRIEHGAEQLMNGDNRAWLEIASRRDDATIMGSWGAYERGGRDVGARYDWAAAQFRPSGTKLRVAYLSSGSGGDVAYTFAIERADPLIVKTTPG